MQIDICYCNNVIICKDHLLQLTSKMSEMLLGKSSPFSSSTTSYKIISCLDTLKVSTEDHLQEEGACQKEENPLQALVSSREAVCVMASVLSC